MARTNIVYVRYFDPLASGKNVFLPFFFFRESERRRPRFPGIGGGEWLYLSEI